MRVWHWLHGHRGEVFGRDSRAGLAAALVTAGLLLLVDARSALDQALMPIVGVAVALLAVILTALAILVAFMGDEYLRVLDRESTGVAEALRPYQIGAGIAAVALLWTVFVHLVYTASPWQLQVALGATVMGLLTWSVWATVEIVNLTAFHGRMRASLLRGIREAKDLLERRKKDAS